jgi:hypothetical protein
MEGTALSPSALGRMAEQLVKNLLRRLAKISANVTTGAIDD